MSEDTQPQRTPISVLAMPSTLEGFTHDILVNGVCRLSVNTDSMDAMDVLELVSESMRIGSELLLSDMGRTVINASEEEH